ncbi:MAG: para-aminobenzoate synthase, subunit, partial [Candidatus Acidoferrum typicum]|nr:para-aminobenzoate synthase, subunit [Candidatus Acidoferrum typicum]
MDVSSTTKIVDSAALDQAARKPGFALIRTGKAWRLYENPKKIIAISDAGALIDSLQTIERHVSAGGEAGGLLHYEAGYAFEPLLRPLLSKHIGTLLWFGLYEGVSVFEDVYFPASEQVNQVENVAATILRNEYVQKLNEIHELIASGEVYQINFTHPVRFHLNSSAWRLFVDLCRHHPMPYAAFINTG